MSLKAIALTLALGLIIAPTTASAASSLLDDHKIFGRDYFVIEAALAEQGITAISIEEWGEVVSVQAKDEDGSQQIILLNKDTLRPLDKRS